MALTSAHPAAAMGGKATLERSRGWSEYNHVEGGSYCKPDAEPHPAVIPTRLHVLPFDCRGDYRRMAAAPPQWVAGAGATVRDLQAALRMSLPT